MTYIITVLAVLTLLIIIKIMGLLCLLYQAADDDEKRDEFIYKSYKERIGRED